MPKPFARVAVLGTGLIGGSFALAMRKHAPHAHITGWDREPILRQARQREAIHDGFTDLARAISGADLVYVALPVGHAIEMLPQIAGLAAPHALVTDACSTKRSLMKVAAQHFPSGHALFLGGHPMAGREISGIGAADAELFRGARYALIGESRAAEGDARIAEFVKLLGQLGVEPIWLDAEAHDRAAAIVSHLPQLAAVALAGVVRGQTEETGLPLTIAGRGLRDALRLAGSPYSVWRDIILTNSDNLDRVLEQFQQAIEQIRNDLRTRALEEQFAAASEIYKILRDLQ